MRSVIDCGSGLLSLSDRLSTVLGLSVIRSAITVTLGILSVRTARNSQPFYEGHFGDPRLIDSGVDNLGIRSAGVLGDLGLDLSVEKRLDSSLVDKRVDRFTIRIGFGTVV